MLTWQPPQRKYQPDWRLPNGILVETKGRLTAADRAKLLYVRNQNPATDLRLVFQYDNYLYRGSETTYTEWAEKNGFKWNMMVIPDEWFNEEGPNK